MLRQLATRTVTSKPCLLLALSLALYARGIEALVRTVRRSI